MYIHLIPYNSMWIRVVKELKVQLRESSETGKEGRGKRVQGEVRRSRGEGICNPNNFFPLSPTFSHFIYHFTLQPAFFIDECFKWNLYTYLPTPVIPRRTVSFHLLKPSHLSWSSFSIIIF